MQLLSQQSSESLLRCWSKLFAIKPLTETILIKNKNKKLLLRVHNKKYWQQILIPQNGKPVTSFAFSKPLRQARGRIKELDSIGAFPFLDNVGNRLCTKFILCTRPVFGYWEILCGLILSYTFSFMNKIRFAQAMR